MKADTQRRPGSKLAVSRDHAKERAADRVAAGVERIAGPVSDAPALPELGLGLGLNLPAFERRYFEQRLGTDLGGVRVHPDSGVVAGLGARALASGRDIAFAPGAWQPRSGGFTQLLGHELAHTAQQRQTGATVQLAPPEPGQGNAPPGQTNPQPDNGNPEPPQGNTNQPAAPAQVPAVGILDDMVIRTYADLAAFYQSHVQTLSAEYRAALGDEASVPAIVYNTQYEGQQNAATMRAGGTAQADDVSYNDALNWFDKFRSAMSSAEAARAVVARAKVAAMQAAAERALEENEKLLPLVEEKRRQAYLNQDSSLLSDLWDISTAIYGAIAGLTPAINDARDLEMQLANGAVIAAAQAGPNVGKVAADYRLPDRSVWGPRMVTFNKAIGLVQVVQNTAALMGSGKTQASEAGEHIKAAVGLTSAVANLVPLAGSLGLEMSTTIPFMVDKCMLALGKVQQISHDINKDLIETGDYDHVNWAVEPGGRPMFDFMLQVMAAGSADGVPTPVPAGVAKYFVENRDDIATGVGGKETKDRNAVPTQRSWVFWREADQSKLPAWVFGHRSDLWTIFYGDIQPPGGAS